VEMQWERSNVSAGPLLLLDVNGWSVGDRGNSKLLSPVAAVAVGDNAIVCYYAPRRDARSSAARRLVM